MPLLCARLPLKCCLCPASRPLTTQDLCHWLRVNVIPNIDDLGADLEAPNRTGLTFRVGSMQGVIRLLAPTFQKMGHATGLTHRKLRTIVAE